MRYIDAADLSFGQAGITPIGKHEQDALAPTGQFGTGGEPILPPKGEGKKEGKESHKKHNTQEPADKPLVAHSGRGGAASGSVFLLSRHTEDKDIEIL